MENQYNIIFPRRIVRNFGTRQPVESLDLLAPVHVSIHLSDLENTHSSIMHDHFNAHFFHHGKAEYKIFNMRIKGIQHFFKLVQDLFYMKRFAKLIKQYGITLDSPQHPESCSFIFFERIWKQFRPKWKHGSDAA
jgi:hypothetical protein